jgi:hypothetical protein
MSMPSTDTGDQPSAIASPIHEKRPYVAPVLQRWGTLRDLTMAVGRNGKSDGGKQSGKKNTRP